MATYSFPPFTESDRVTLLKIIDPVITVKLDNINIRPLDSMIDVDIAMEISDCSKFEFRLKDVPVQNMEYIGYQNLYDTVILKLAEYEVDAV